MGGAEGVCFDPAVRSGADGLTVDRPFKAICRLRRASVLRHEPVKLTKLMRKPSGDSVRGA